MWLPAVWLPAVWLPSLRYRAVIFDLDGLMVDSEPLQLRAWNRAIEPFGVALAREEYARDFVGKHATTIAAQIAARFGLDARGADIFHTHQAVYEDLLREPTNLHAQPGVFDLVGALTTRGVPLAVASSSPRGDIENVLRGLNLREVFRVVVSTAEVERAKPAPDVYLRVAERLGCAPRECVALEDSAAGVQSAKRAGMFVIAVPNEFTRGQDVSAADARVEDLFEVGRLLGVE